MNEKTKIDNYEKKYNNFKQSLTSAWGLWHYKSNNETSVTILQL